LRRSIRGTRRSGRAAPLLAALLLGLAALGSGCGATTTSEAGASEDQGKELFVQQCGGCHTLADAGTLGQTGPNLDYAFGPSREDGFAENTFFEVTLEKMKIPGNGSVMPDFDDDANPDTYLNHDQLVDIAAYVAAVAGIPPTGGGGTGTEGAQDPKSLFVTACGSCHTLEDAATSGTVGPNLDDAQPGLDQAIAQITNGGGGMPPFGDQLSEEQIRALAEYIVQATGGR
jgi:mono/diheme cytochrome c family protein